MLFLRLNAPALMLFIHGAVLAFPASISRYFNLFVVLFQLFAAEQKHTSPVTLTLFTLNGATRTLVSAVTITSLGFIITIQMDR